jgi:hypothetical protein
MQARVANCRQTTGSTADRLGWVNYYDWVKHAGWVKTMPAFETMLAG